MSGRQGLSIHLFLEFSLLFVWVFFLSVTQNSLLSCLLGKEKPRNRFKYYQDASLISLEFMKDCRLYVRKGRRRTERRRLQSQQDISLPSEFHVQDSGVVVRTKLECLTLFRRMLCHEYIVRNEAGMYRLCSTSRQYDLISCRGKTYFVDISFREQGIKTRSKFSWIFFSFVYVLLCLLSNLILSFQDHLHLTKITTRSFKFK